MTCEVTKITWWTCQIGSLMPVCWPSLIASNASLKTRYCPDFSHHGRDLRMIANDSNGQEKQLIFWQHLANVNRFICKDASSYAHCQNLCHYHHIFELEAFLQTKWLTLAKCCQNISCFSCPLESFAIILRSLLWCEKSGPIYCLKTCNGCY